MSIEKKEPNHDQWDGSCPRALLYFLGAPLGIFLLICGVTYVFHLIALALHAAYGG